MPHSPFPMNWRVANLQREIDDAFATWIEAPWARQFGASPTTWPAIDLLLLTRLALICSGDVENRSKRK